MLVTNISDLRDLVSNKVSGLIPFTSDAKGNKDSKVLPDYVFTVGCFDLFHDGHRRLLARMRKFGVKLVVGVHDDVSISKLKNRVPMDPTEKRVNNVSEFADRVFVVAGTDPTPFLEEVVKELGVGHGHDSMKAVYVRGNDMPNFPGRALVERHMSVQLLPYTEGVSSTALRRQLSASNPSLVAARDRLLDDYQRQRAITA